MIHPTAIISPQAELGADVEIGPSQLSKRVFSWATDANSTPMW